jgi:hypothetical protein
VSHRRLYGGKLLPCDFKIFVLRVNVNVFHCGEVFPAAHGLKRLVIHASAMGACGEGMPEAVRRFAEYIDRFLYTLPEASVGLKGQRGMRIT